MNYQIVILPAAQREIEKLPKKMAQSIIEKIHSLGVEPRPFGYKKLNNFNLSNLKIKPLYRIRVGDFRIIYAIENTILNITIVKVAHRSGVYE